MPPRPSPPTHFLCIPLAGAQLARSLAAFRSDATANHDVPDDAVRPLGTLHLTLGVMTLRTEEADGVRRATEVLKRLRLRDMLAAARRDGGGVENARLAITLRGLHAMQTPSKTAVLYAPPTEDGGVLRRFCEAVREPFVQAGLLTVEDRPLLLHATVVNTIYVRGRRGRGRVMLDARELMGRYEEFVWVDGMEVGRVAMCRMGAKRVGGEEGARYEVEAEVEF